MERLGEINLEQSLALTLNYSLDQSLLARNFTTIIDALKELQQKQDSLAKANPASTQDSSLLDELAELRKRIEKVESREPEGKKDGV